MSFSEFSSRILNFITTIILVRLFTVDDYGHISIATAIYSYGVLLSVHWFNPFGIKKISSGENGDFVSRLTSIRFILALLASLIILIISFILQIKSDFRELIFYFSLSLIPSAFFLDWYFQARENLKPIAYSRFLLSLAYLLFLLFVVFFKKGISFVGLAFFAANITCAIYLIIYYLIYYRKLVTLSFQNWWGIFRESLPLSSATVFSQLNVNLPILLIGVFISAYDVGMFSAAYKLIFFLLLMDRLYYLIFFPAFTRIYNFKKELTETFFNISLKITLILITLIASASIIYAPELITLIFGREYIESVFVFRILIFYFVLTIINSIFSFGLITIGEERYYSRVIFISVLLNTILLLVFINLYGTIGAALTVVLVESFILVLFFIRFKKFVQLMIKNYILKIIILNSVVSMIVLYIKSLNEIFTLIFGILLYIIGLFLFRIILNDELNLIKAKIWT